SRNRTRVFQYARGARSVAGSEVGIRAHAEVSCGTGYGRDVETEEVQTQARSVAVVGIRVRGLLFTGDRLLGEFAHVGDDTVPAVVLLRFWLHGRDERAANRERQANLSSLATGQNLTGFTRLTGWS